MVVMQIEFGVSEPPVVGRRNHGDLPALLVEPIPVDRLVQSTAVQLDRLLFRHPAGVIAGQAILPESVYRSFIRPRISRIMSSRSASALLRSLTNTSKL